MKGYSIVAAEEGGFIVIEAFVHPGVIPVPLFAGPLHECLTFVERKMGSPK